MEKVWLVMTTFGEEQEAKRVVRELLSEGLIACANLLPRATSLYLWKGELCEDLEVVVLLKTTEEAYPRLQAALVKKHSYEEPEIVAFETVDGSEGYLNFVRKVMKVPE